MPYSEGMASSSTAPNHPYPGNFTARDEYIDRAWEDINYITQFQEAVSAAMKKVKSAERNAAGQSYRQPIFAFDAAITELDQIHARLEADAKLIAEEAGIR